MYFNKIPSKATRCKVHTTNFNFKDMTVITENITLYSIHPV